MKKYFSSAICSNGYICAYNTIYKKDSNAVVYIINSGDDFERAKFFSRLTKHLSGYNITLFNPFYDDATDGIYIENLNTYIISDGGYNKISPLFPGMWEKYINVTENKTFPKELIREVLIHRARENNHYKNACKELKRASIIKERLHSELSKNLNEEKIINYIHRFCSKELKNTLTRGNGEIRLLSSPTPLGFHTHYDTIFENCNKVINIIDETSFTSSILLGVIKNYALREKIEILASPSYFGNDFYQFLIFPAVKLGLCVSDNNHTLPFEANEVLTSSRFFVDNQILNSKKIKALISIENSLLDKAVLSLYEGRDERFKYNNLTQGFSSANEAEENADNFAEKLLN